MDYLLFIVGHQEGIWGKEGIAGRGPQILGIFGEKKVKKGRAKLSLT